MSFQPSSPLYSLAFGSPAFARIPCAFDALLGSLSQRALISTPSICDIRCTAPGPRWPKPMNPIRTLSILGAAYPLMLKRCGLVRCTSDATSCATAGNAATAPDRRVAFFRKFLRLYFIMENWACAAEQPQY